MKPDREFNALKDPARDMIISERTRIPGAMGVQQIMPKVSKGLWERDWETDHAEKSTRKWSRWKMKLKLRTEIGRDLNPLYQTLF